MLSTRNLLIAFFVLFNVFSVTRIVSGPKANIPTQHLMYQGNPERTITRIFDMAQSRALKENNPAPLIFANHNPGLFLFIAEMFVRSGAKNPTANQLFGLFLFNLGLIFSFLWVQRLFKSQELAIASLIFLLLSAYPITHTISIHMHPYHFFGFNLCIWSLLKYLDLAKFKYLALSLLAYLLVCMNYTMYYMSTFIFAAGLFWQFKPKGLKREFLFYVFPPFLGIGSVLYQMIASHGSTAKALFYFKEIALRRSLDIKTAGGSWNPNKSYLELSDFYNYPALLDSRMLSMFHLSLIMLAILFICARKTVKLKAITMPELRPLVYIAPAALSWWIVMIQHSKIHYNSNIYGYFLWMIIFSWSVLALYKSKWPQTKSAWIGWSLILFFIAKGTYEVYLRGLYYSIANL